MKKRISIISLLVVFLLSLNFNIVLAQDTTKTSKINTVMDVINDYYKDNIDQDKLTNGAIQGMLQTLDPYSVYLTKEDYNKMMESLNGEYSGIGVAIQKVDNYIQISEVFENSPAQKAGLKVGDKFTEIDGKSAINMDTNTFVSIVKGPTGTSINVKIIRDNAENPISIDITRDSIKIESVKYKIIDNIGYVSISSFDDSVSDKFAEALKYFDKNKINKIIIDLRGNPGGYLISAVNLCRQIIPKGPIVHIREKDVPLQTYYSYLNSSKYKIAVLVDGGSASAAEITAGAIQDSKAGVLVGTQTYGKGTVQGFINLSNGDYVKITIANYLTPNKRLIDKVGLTPDYVVENYTERKGYTSIEPFRNIYVGNTGPDVHIIEQDLSYLGYISGEPNDKYDLKVADGILQYEKDHKLSSSKIISLQLQNTIQKEISETDLQLNKAIEILNK